MKVKLESITPLHVIDVWRLVEKATEGQLYPDISEEPSEAHRSFLFAYMQSPLFCGLIAKIGKRPIGLIFGDITMRAFGRPSKYLSVKMVFVEPSFRTHGVAKRLWEEFTLKIKKAGISHFEASVKPGFEHQFQHLQSVIGGKL